MKKAIILVTIIISMIGCRSDNVFPESYPFFITNQLSNIKSTSIDFSANVISIGTEKINDYGFQWEYKSKIFNTSVFKNDKPVSFSLTIYENYELGNTKYYRAYMKTDKHIVYSNWAEL